MSSPSPPTPTPRLPGLDTLRALAILLVMTFHLGFYLPVVLEPLAKIGWIGVDLFFVLSGYLIGLQLLRPYLRAAPPLLWNFYRRRALRILPAYLTVVALYFLWPAWREQTGLSPLWEFLTFTENLSLDYARNKAFSHVWSLCIEEHFYLILPLVVLVLMRRPSFSKTMTLFLSILILGIAIRWYELVHVLQATPINDDDWYVLYYEHIYYPTWTRLDDLLAGVALAATQTFRPNWWARIAAHPCLLLVSALTLCSTALWLFKDRTEADTGVAAWGTVIGFPVLSLAFALLVLVSVSRTGPLARHRIPGAETLATLAYTLYLTHKEAAHLMRLWFPTATAHRGPQSLAIYCIACITAATLLHLAVERPFLGLRERTRKIAADPAL